MRNIHPAAWCGLLLNFAVVHLFFYALTALDLSELAPEQRAEIADLEEVFDTMRVMMYGLLVLQGLAIGLIASRHRLGLILAACSSFLLAPPLSLLYFMGCALSAARVRFAGFPTAPKHPEELGRPLQAFRPYAARVTRNAMLVCMGVSVLAVATGWVKASATLFCVTLCFIYMAMRTAKAPALALYNEGFTLLPSLFADRLMLPYSAITQATLLDNESIHFQIDLSGTRKELTWPLAVVEPAERRAALEELGSALAANNVPLA